MIRSRFAAVVGALVRSLAPAGEARPETARFVLSQQAAMPDFLRLPIVVSTLLFDFAGIAHAGRCFRHQTLDAQRAQVAAWRDSPHKFGRDLIRFYESLATLGNADEPTGLPVPAPFHMPPRLREGETRREIVVIGSGPGGSITGCLLAEAGRNVTLLEEGPALPVESCRSFSAQEMEQKYRNHGLTPALGSPSIAYGEGRCVGGGSEINAGLYHRTPPEVLDQWRRDFGVEDLDAESLRPHFEAVERDLSVGLFPDGKVPLSSLKLHQGAQSLGWKSFEVPRWFKFDPSASSEAAPTGERQSMSRTYLPRALAAGAELLPGHRAVRLRRDGKGWRVSGTGPDGRPFSIVAGTVFASGGAIQTPALLRRSGIRKNIGRSLQLHATLKVVAEFSEKVNSERMGVTVHQVKEFADRFSFGCSISTPTFLRLALLDHPAEAARVGEAWRHMAVYYAMISTGGHGTVDPLPFFHDPLVRYRLTTGDFANLTEALQKLSRLLFVAGASTVLPSLRGLPVLRSAADLGLLPALLTPEQANLMTIHLFSSCPMGENLDRCAADSHGRVHGHPGLHIADGSLLCTSPHVNPQGTIMGICRRNALRFLGK